MCSVDRSMDDYIVGRIGGLLPGFPILPSQVAMFSGMFCSEER